MMDTGSDESYYLGDVSSTGSSVFEYDSLGYTDSESDVTLCNNVTYTRQCAEAELDSAVPAIAVATAVGNRVSPRRRIRYSSAVLHRSPNAIQKVSDQDEKPPGDFVLSAYSASSEKRLPPARDSFRNVSEKDVLVTPTSSKIKQMDSDTALKILTDLGEEEPSKEEIEVFQRWLAAPSDVTSSFLMTSLPSITSSTFGKPSAVKVAEPSKEDYIGLNIFDSWYRDICGRTYPADCEHPSIVHRYSYFLKRLFSLNEESVMDKMDVFHKWLATPSGAGKTSEEGLNMFVNWYRDVNAPDGASDFKTPSVLQKGSLPFQYELYREKHKNVTGKNLETLVTPRSDTNVDDVRNHQAESAGSLVRNRQRVNKKQRGENTHHRNTS